MKRIKLSILISITFLVCPVYTNSQVTQQWMRVYNGYGYGADAGLALTVDDSGYVYVTGSSEGQNNWSDIFTVKYAPNDGTEVWARRYRDTAYGDYASKDIITDTIGNVYVTGSRLLKYSSSGNLLWSYFEFNKSGVVILFDSFNNLYDGGSIGSYSYLLRKFTPDGILLWERTYRIIGIPTHYVTDIVIDKAGNVIITGISENSNYDFDYATLKYTSNGDLLWLRRYNGPAQYAFDLAYGIAVDDSNNIYVTGWSEAITYNADIFTIKYNPDGDTLWTARYNGINNGGDVGYDIATDSLGFVYVVGKTDGGSFASLKYDRNGNLLWVSRLQSQATFAPFPIIKLDRERNVYISATTYRQGGNSNYVVVKYNNNGVQQWVKEFYCGSLNELYDMEVDKNTNIYVTGRSACGTGDDCVTVKYIQNPSAIKNFSSLMPTENELFQNYPNPFNPKSKIKFQISKSSEVKLLIYDLLGRELAVFNYEDIKPGTYEQEIDLTGFPSGTYFYQMITNGFKQTKRIVLLK